MDSTRVYDDVWVRGTKSGIRYLKDEINRLCDLRLKEAEHDLAELLARPSTRKRSKGNDKVVRQARVVRPDQGA